VNYRFLDHLGKVFNFVKADLVDKFQNIEKCIENDPNGSCYVTVQSFIEHEKSNQIYMVNHNATLSLLRLIRGLDFIRKFLENLNNNKENNKKSPELAWSAYNDTLSFRHNWAVRRIVKTGLYLLPYKSDLIVIMSSGIENKQDGDKVFSEFLYTIDKIYMTIHKVYEKEDFLELVLA